MIPMIILSNQRIDCALVVFFLIISNGITESNCQNYDAIVVGGGAGGCVAAQTMVENGNKVLLLERGGEPTSSLLKDDIFVILNPRVNKCIEAFDGDGVVVATGNCLGGATTYNQGIWIEEQPDFLDTFGGLFATDHVAAAFKYVTDQFGFTSTTQSDPKAKVYIDQLIQAFDYNPLFDIANVTPGQAVLPKEGIWRPRTLFRQGTGMRRSADQILDRTNPNLEVRLHAKVTRITFQNVSNVPTATCVEYTTTTNSVTVQKVCVKNGGRIYLAAGAFHTPILLMKSGIKKNGKIYNNDQVGKNLSDKPMCYVAQALNKNFNYTSLTIGEVGAYTKHTLSSGRVTGLLYEESSFSLARDAGQSNVFERSLLPVGTRFTVKATFTLRWVQYCINRLNRTAIGCRSINSFLNKYSKVFFLPTMVATPQSTGQVTLMKNGEIRISPGYLTTDDDIEAMGFALRTSYNISTSITGPFTPLSLYGPQFLTDAGTLTDRQIGIKAKKEIISPHHFAGTAAVGRVVDNQLKVIGVDGLYVADASALPWTPRVNSMPSAMMIGRLAGSSFT